MKTSEIARIFDEIFCKERQCAYDNAGYNIMCEAEVTGIYITLDFSEEVIIRAKNSGANFILTHHPIIFDSIKSISCDYTSKLIRAAINSNLAVYSAHTNADIMEAGLNDYVANLIGAGDIKLLSPEGGRMGCIEPTALNVLAKNISIKFNDKHIKYIGDCDKLISRIAIINGSGGRDIDIINICIEKKIEVLITSEVKYSCAKLAKDEYFAIIEVGHYESEAQFVEWASKLIINEPRITTKLIMDRESSSPYNEEII